MLFDSEAQLQPSPCEHQGLHSPIAHYERARGEIRYVTVCDGCGSEVREVHRESYAPAFDPAGNDAYLASVA